MESKDLEKILQALRGIRADGLTVTIGTVRHSETDAKATVTFRLADAPSPEQSALQANYPHVVGRAFTRDGRRYTVWGLVPRARKYPVIAERDDGLKFKFTADAVNLLLGLHGEDGILAGC